MNSNLRLYCHYQLSYYRPGYLTYLPLIILQFYQSRQNIKTEKRMNRARLVGRFGWENAHFLMKMLIISCLARQFIRKCVQNAKKCVINSQYRSIFFSKHKFKLVSRSPISLVLGSKYQIFPQIHTLPSHESPFILYHLCPCYYATPFFRHAPISWF